MIPVKSSAEFERMKRVGRVIGGALNELRKHVVPGVTTEALDRIAESWIERHEAVPAFKGYHGFPSTLCVSVNEEVVHGIPGSREIVDGDLVSIDVGAVIDGFHADAARTFFAGKPDKILVNLAELTKRAFWKGVAQAKPGNRVSDISHAVGSFATKHGLGIVRQYVGHGIGIKLHEEPQIPNFGSPGQGEEIHAGMAFAIEPMLNLGSGEVELLENGWTVITKDGKPSAHYENTVLVTENGPEVITEYA